MTCIYLDIAECGMLAGGDFHRLVPQLKWTKGLVIVISFSLAGKAALELLFVNCAKT